MIAVFDHNAHWDNSEVIGGKVEFSKTSSEWIYKRKYTRKSTFWWQELLDKIISEIP